MHPIEILWARAAALAPTVEADPEDWSPPTHLPPNLSKHTNTGGEQNTRVPQPTTRKQRRITATKGAYYKAHKRQAVATASDHPTAGPDKNRCMHYHMDPDSDRFMLECHICQTGMHLDCQDPPMHTVPRGEWVCNTCTHYPDTLVSICNTILSEYTKQAKQLGMKRTSTRGHPHSPVKHVRSLCSTPYITWAAYLALYSEQDEAIQIVGGPSTINNTSKKKIRKDNQQTRYMLQ